MSVSIIIPAKGSSERVPKKNLLDLNGHSLVYSACDKCLGVPSIDNVYIDTESQEIIDDVTPLIEKGLRVIRRPDKMADNDTSGNDLIVFEQSMIDKCDLVLHTYATSPFITTETIESCIETFQSKQARYLCYDRQKQTIDHASRGLIYDSFFTALPVKEYFWSKGKPVNFDLDTLPNSQNLGTMWVETHGLYGITWNALTKFRRRLGERVLPIQINEDEALDINTPLDYEKAVKQHEQRTEKTLRESV